MTITHPCARCKKLIVDMTPETSTVVIYPSFGEPGDETGYVLCADCTAAVRVWLVTPPDERGE